MRHKFLILKLFFISFVQLAAAQDEFNPLSIEIVTKCRGEVERILRQQEQNGRNRWGTRYAETIFERCLALSAQLMEKSEEGTMQL